jgi:[acyl-carrier-protein] S-malonyltransferase
MGLKEKKLAFLFPGQGAQYPKMALDFFEVSSAVRELFSLASKQTGIDLYELLAKSDENELKRTDRAQIAITLANLASAEFLQENNVFPAAVAGHSLGEYAALVTAGVISKEDCFLLVKARAEAMNLAVAACNGGMSAVLGANPETVEKITGELRESGFELYAANFNSQRQTVISGTETALKEAEAKLKAAGARRVIRLPVAGAFHSPFMSAAAESFNKTLLSVNFVNPKIDFFSNVEGRSVKDAAIIKTLAAKQITAPVLWTKEEAALELMGFDAVIETGPGTALSALWRDSGTKTPCFNAGTLVNAKETLSALNE